MQLIWHSCCNTKITKRAGGRGHYEAKVLAPLGQSSEVKHRPSARTAHAHSSRTEIPAALLPHPPDFGRDELVKKCYSRADGLSSRPRRSARGENPGALSLAVEFGSAAWLINTAM